MGQLVYKDVQKCFGLCSIFNIAEFCQIIEIMRILQNIVILFFKIPYKSALRNIWKHLVLVF